MIYLDNAATTKPLFHRSDYDDLWFNNNMFYSDDTAYLSAKEHIKKILNVENGDVLFFRCATEAVEWLSKFVSAYCSQYEHSSVYTISNSYNYNSAYANQLVNQITGSIFDIENISKEKKNDYNFFLSDYTSAIGHVKLPKQTQYIDAIWFSGHKFHTEKGIGAMWVSDNIRKMLPNKVNGTMDIEGILMLKDALGSANNDIEIKESKWKMLSNILLKDLKDENIDCRYIADGKPRTKAINALYLNRINADALAYYLAYNKRIYVGLGHSACEDSKDYKVLNSFGLSNNEASQVIRVSFDENTTIHDVKALSESIINFKKIFIGD